MNASPYGNYFTGYLNSEALSDSLNEEWFRSKQFAQQQIRHRLFDAAQSFTYGVDIH